MACQTMSLECHYDTQVLAHVARLYLHQKGHTPRRAVCVFAALLRQHAARAMCERVRGLVFRLQNVRCLWRSQACELLCPLLRDTMHSCAGKQATPQLSHVRTQLLRVNGSDVSENFVTASGTCVSWFHFAKATPHDINCPPATQPKTRQSWRCKPHLSIRGGVDALHPCWRFPSDVHDVSRHPLSSHRVCTLLPEVVAATYEWHTMAPNAVAMLVALALTKLSAALRRLEQLSTGPQQLPCAFLEENGLPLTT